MFDFTRAPSPEEHEGLVHLGKQQARAKGARLSPTYPSSFASALLTSLKLQRGDLVADFERKAIELSSEEELATSRIEDSDRLLQESAPAAFLPGKAAPESDYQDAFRRRRARSNATANANEAKSVAATARKQAAFAFVDLKQELLRLEALGKEWFEPYREGVAEIDDELASKISPFPENEMFIHDGLASAAAIAAQYTGLFDVGVGAHALNSATASSRALEDGAKAEPASHIRKDTTEEDSDVL